MKKINKIQIGAAIMGVIVTTAIVAGATYASENSETAQKFMSWRNGNGKGEMKRLNENSAGRAALEAGDYNAWLAAMPENCPMRADATEENFNKMVEMHKLMQAGKFEEAQVIREELGLRRSGPNEERGCHGNKNFGGNEAARTAIENNDYNAWLAAMPENCPMRADATEENFNKMVEMHKLMQASDFEGAKEIGNELGLKGLGGKMKHQCQSQNK